MPSESGQWIIPAPLRTLLWWPLIAFVVAVVGPPFAPLIIAAAGAGLAVVGVLGAAIRSLGPVHVGLGDAVEAVSSIHRPTPGTGAGDAVPTPDGRAA